MRAVSVCKDRSLDHNYLTTLPYTVFSPLTAAESLLVEHQTSIVATVTNGAFSRVFLYF